MPRNTPIRKDWFLSGLLVGMTLSTVRMFVTLGMSRAGFPVKPHASTAGSMIFAKKRRLGGLVSEGKGSSWENVISHSADIAFGGLLGIATTYVLTKTPPGNEMVKGAAVNTGISAGSIVLAKMLNLAEAANTTPQEFASAMALATLFGGLEGAYFARYGTHMITQSHPALVKEVTNAQFDRGRLTVNSSAKS